MTCSMGGQAVLPTHSRGRIHTYNAADGAHRQCITVNECRRFALIAGSLCRRDDHDRLVPIQVELVSGVAPLCSPMHVVLVAPHQTMLPYASYSHLQQLVRSHRMHGGPKKLLAQLESMVEQHRCTPFRPVDE